MFEQLRNALCDCQYVCVRMGTGAFICLQAASLKGMSDLEVALGDILSDDESLALPDEFLDSDGGEPGELPYARSDAADAAGESADCVQAVQGGATDRTDPAQPPASSHRVKKTGKEQVEWCKG